MDYRIDERNLSINTLRILIAAGSIITYEAVEYVIHRDMHERGKILFETLNKEYVRDCINRIFVSSKGHISMYNANFVRLLIEYGLNAAMFVHTGTMIYHIERNDYEIIKILFDAGVRSDISMLYPAVWVGDLRMVELVLSKVSDPNLLTRDKENVFDYVSDINFDRIVRLLIEAGVNPNKGSELILCKAVRFDSFDTFKYLLDKGANPFTINRARWNAFVLAIRYRKEEFVAEIIRRHPDLKGSYVLIYSSDPKITKMLIDAGAK